MDRILITGGAGFIGSNLVDKLLKNGEKVYVVDNFDSFYKKEIKMNNIKHNLNNPNFHFFECDIKDEEQTEKIIKENEIKVIAHLAARPGVKPSIENPMIYQDINIRGTITLLEVSRKCNVENFIFASSSSVYGAVKTPFIEEQSCNPISPYGASKLSCEAFCRTYSYLYKIPISCLRFFTVYGPRQRPDMAIHKFTSLIDSGKEVEIYGDGSSKRDYTYIGDIVDGIISTINKKFDFEIFNLGNSKTVKLRYLISLIEKELGRGALIKYLPMQPGDMPITWADTSKAKELLGYTPTISIEEGIRKFVDWYKNRMNF